jgi:hypothetical protein
MAEHRREGLAGSVTVHPGDRSLRQGSIVLGSTPQQLATGRAPPLTRTASLSARGSWALPPSSDPTAQRVVPAQRVVLYEEDPADPNGKSYIGWAIWRTKTFSLGPGEAPERAVLAEVEIPERRLAMTLSMRRNTDKALPASHTMEIMFNVPTDFPFGGISNVPGILLKEAEMTRGAPLSGLSVESNFFLLGLSAVESEKARNLQLLRERGWFDIPIVYKNGRRAIVAIEKGDPGERAFAEAFKWALPEAAPPPAMNEQRVLPRMEPPKRSPRDLAIAPATEEVLGRIPEHLRSPSTEPATDVNSWLKKEAPKPRASKNSSPAGLVQAQEPNAQSAQPSAGRERLIGAWVVLVVIGVGGIIGIIVSIFGRRALAMRARDKAAREREDAERQRRSDCEREKARQQEQTKQQEPEPETGPPWWEVLGVSPEASPDEIRRCYAEKLKQYHPDRVNGLAHEIVELAERKTKELNAAFAKAKRIMQLGREVLENV